MVDIHLCSQLARSTEANAQAPGPVLYGVYPVWKLKHLVCQGVLPIISKDILHIVFLKIFEIILISQDISLSLQGLSFLVQRLQVGIPASVSVLHFLLELISSQFLKV